MTAFPRLRMFAGPNGSGKSTLKSILPPISLGVYINPDEIEEKIRTTGSLNLEEFGIEAHQQEIIAFFQKSSLLKDKGVMGLESDLKLIGQELQLRQGKANSYAASVIADFIRQKLLEKKVSFTFETVMSSKDKVALLEKAQTLGYRTYLYYIATDDPEINISRVSNRVKLKGHPVSEEKIRSRYHRSLDLLMEAILKSNRAFMFDNSTDGAEKIWFAEITEGKTIEVKNSQIPYWFKSAVLDKADGKKT